MAQAGHVAVVGAGIGGLSAALEMAAAGLRVTVVERAPKVGGKIWESEVAGRTIDAGPTLLTMRWAFEEVFRRAGAELDALVPMRRASVLGRFCWSGDGHLDLHADLARSADAIGAFAGSAEAGGFRRFSEAAQRAWALLEHRFVRRELPDSALFALSAGPAGLLRLRPFANLWSELERFFKDARLRQLFGRTSTDHGTSPFQAPAAAIALAHLEQQGVWTVEGGTVRLPEAMAALLGRLGGTVRLGTCVSEILVQGGTAVGLRLDTGEQVRADAVVMNGEPAALAEGLLGSKLVKAAPRSRFPQRSLSAVTWATVAETEGLPLLRRTVFFSRDNKQEFEQINIGRLPLEPTITVIALDRGDAGGAAPAGGERLLIAVNAPPSGDRRAFAQVEIEQCMGGMVALMKRCGLDLRLVAPPAMTTPVQFHRMFPASGGGLYGNNLAGAAAAFNRPATRTKVKNLFLAGAGTHPGPGMGFAAISGQLAGRAAALALKRKR